MALPPLQSVPVLERLLAPGETLIYTAKFHPLMGWPWMLGALFSALLTVWLHMPLLTLPTLILAAMWMTPFASNQMAVTNMRLLLRTGKFKLRLEALTSDQFDTWRIRQTLLTSALHCGTIILVVREGRDVRHVVIPWVWHPLTFAEALETLQPELRRDLDA